MTASKLSLIYFTASNKIEAEALSEQLVQRKLAACCNLLPAESSMYFWQDKLEKSTEWIVLVKTRTELFEPIENFLDIHHSYDTPCVLSLPIDRASAKYQQWVLDSTVSRESAK